MKLQSDEKQGSRKAQIPEEAHIVAYYLAKFPHAYQALNPGQSMSTTLLFLSHFFSMPDSSFKRLRDEYDAFFPHRRGYKGADQRKSRVEIHERFNALTQVELHEKVKSIINEEGIDTGPCSECEDQRLWEGKRIQVFVNKYERKRFARLACLNHYGKQCQGCLSKLSDIYGPDADEIVDVHHVKPISEIGDAYRVDPVIDLVPLCPNCHRFVHTRNPPWSVAELKERLKIIRHCVQTD